MNLSKYDQNALALAKDFKYPEQSIWTSIRDAVNAPFEKAGDLINSIPGVDDAFSKAASGLVTLFSTAATYSVRQDAIFEEFRNDGHKNIYSLKDIQSLSLEDIDKTVGYLKAKYNGIAAAEGLAVAGAPYLAGPAMAAAAVAAIAADVPLFTGLCLRAIAEYATYYGFDINRQEEQAYALHILDLSSTSTKGRDIILAQLRKISMQLAKKAAWRELDKNLFVKIIKSIAESLGIRITKGKLAMVVPLAGITVNTGFNTFMMNKVCDTAYIMYRERFLATHYNNADLIS